MEKMMSHTILIGKEREIRDDLGKTLESCMKNVKKVDREIYWSLGRSGKILGYVNRLPVVRDITSNVMPVKPIASLVADLRRAMNDSLVSFVRVGEKVEKEKQRIKQLNEIYDIAIEEDWDPAEFNSFFEDNTDLEFVVSTTDHDIDVKEMMNSVYQNYSPDKKEQMKKEYFEHFKNHIHLSEQYLEAMHSLCSVCTDWIGGMTRSYFDLTQMQSNMEEIDRTLKNLGRGGAGSMATQQAFREYGNAYVNGMISLVRGYKKMCALKDEGTNDFNESLVELKEELNTPYVEPKKISSHGYTIRR